MPSLHGGGILLCMGGAPGVGWHLSQDIWPALKISRGARTAELAQVRRIRRFSPPGPGQGKGGGRAVLQVETLGGSPCTVWMAAGWG